MVNPAASRAIATEGGRVQRPPPRRLGGRSLPQSVNEQTTNPCKPEPLSQQPGRKLTPTDAETRACDAALQVAGARPPLSVCLRADSRAFWPAPAPLASGRVPAGTCADSRSGTRERAGRWPRRQAAEVLIIDLIDLVSPILTEFDQQLDKALAGAHYAHAYGHVQVRPGLHTRRTALKWGPTIRPWHLP